jgi:2-polyprenyl-6-methoxyphenol hydroxylase-like FAD-dependent oxidoreductase
MGFLLEDRHLYAAFLAAMGENPNVTLLSGETVVAQEVAANGVTVRLASGKTLSARLLVGCDGRGSGRQRARASAASAGATGRPRWSRRYGTSGITKAPRTSSSCPKGRWPSCH